MKRILLLCGVLFSISSVMATENVLQRIEVEPVKDTYNIVLVADKAVDVKKEVQAPNKITLKMKDMRVSKNLNTLYNNVTNVDTVMVEPDGNGISILFQAENAQMATVTFDSLVGVTKPQQTQSESIKLNNPIESYAPIYHEDFNTDKTSGLLAKLKNVSATNEIKDSLDEDMPKEGANKLISFGLITLLVISILKVFRKKDPEMKIGLTQSLNDREIGLYGANKTFNTNYIPEKPFTTVNYGLNAYKNENRNPYETAPMQFHNPKMRKYMEQAQPQMVEQTVSKPVQTVNSATATAPKMTTRNSVQSNPNIDNLRFLESMTAIYEKSGRHDLAQGLKSSLSKNMNL